MPKISVVIFCEEDGTAQLPGWLARIPTKARDKLAVRIERLEDLGYQLKRPEADYLRDGIYELRVSLQRVNYRILYFFNGKVAAVLSQGLTKEDVVPPKDIDRAVARAALFRANPKRHTYKGELE